MSAGTTIVEKKLSNMPLCEICQIFREIEYWHEEGNLPQNSLYKQLRDEINEQTKLECKDWLEHAILFVISKKYVDYAESLWDASLNTPLNTKPWENDNATI